ncbi:MAG: hypothetical protein WCJ19_03590 [bacterium]
MKRFLLYINPLLIVGKVGMLISFLGGLIVGSILIFNFSPYFSLALDNKFSSMSSTSFTIYNEENDYLIQLRNFERLNDVKNISTSVREYLKIYPMSNLGIVPQCDKGNLTIGKNNYDLQKVISLFE